MVNIFNFLQNTFNDFLVWFSDGGNQFKFALGIVVVEFLFFLILSVSILAFYFIPTMIAFRKDHERKWLILVLNLFLGVSVIGYILCLVWALLEESKRGVINNYGYSSTNNVPNQQHEPKKPSSVFGVLWYVIVIIFIIYCLSNCFNWGYVKNKYNHLSTISSNSELSKKNTATNNEPLNQINQYIKISEGNIFNIKDVKNIIPEESGKYWPFNYPKDQIIIAFNERVQAYGVKVGILNYNFVDNIARDKDRSPLPIFERLYFDPSDPSINISIWISIAPDGSYQYCGISRNCRVEKLLGYIAGNSVFDCGSSEKYSYSDLEYIPLKYDDILKCNKVSCENKLQPFIKYLDTGETVTKINPYFSDETKNCFKWTGSESIINIGPRSYSIDQVNRINELLPFLKNISNNPIIKLEENVSSYHARLKQGEDIIKNQLQGTNPIQSDTIGTNLIKSNTATPTPPENQTQGGVGESSGARLKPQ